jgi:hypothetical protein
MPKLDPTGTKTDQLEFAKSQVFRALSGELLVGMRRGIALITRLSNRAEKSKNESVKEVRHQPLSLCGRSRQPVPARGSPPRQVTAMVVAGCDNRR